MQKLFLFTALAFLISFSTQAQRYTDLGMTVTNVGNGDTLFVGDTQITRFSVKNLGPDTLLVSDTMAIEVKINNVVVGFPPNLNPFMARTGYSLIPGDSTFLDINTVLDSNMLGDYVVCGRVWPLNSALLFMDTLMGNNSSCKTLRVEHRTVTIYELTHNENTLSVYPNPAFSQINVELNASEVPEEPLEVALYDIVGKKVHYGTMDAGKYSINVVDLPKGSYVLKLTNKSGRGYNAKVLKE